MAKLVCPCGHPVELHDWEGCQANTNVAPNFVCMCQHDEAQAIRAAQRKAAIEHLKELGASRRHCLRVGALKGAMEYKAIMVFVRNAYHAVGILGQRKGGE